MRTHFLLSERRTLFRSFLRSIALSALVIAVSASVDVLVRGAEEAKSDGRIVTRFLRTGLTFSLIAADFKYTWWRHPEGSSSYETATEAVHARTADRLLHLAVSNKGLYIKTGQYMASASHVLPVVYGQKLKSLQDAAPVMSPEDMMTLFREEFPDVESFDDLFVNFNYHPIAAASIAQVHVAYLPDGQKVAVKLQHPNLKKEFVVDLFAHYFVLRVAEMLFPNFILTWMHDEIAKNLTKELDFIHEANNSETAARWYQVFQNTTVKIPRVIWPLTTKRILTMEFCEGIKINDTKRLEASGISVIEALTQTLQALSEQIFLHGFVHSDPHPGNILVSKDVENDNKLRVVLLDWGLCRLMREDVRLHYCQLWEALVLHDDDQVKASLQTMGVNVEDAENENEQGISAWEIIALSILMRPYHSSKKGKKKSSMDFIRKMTSQEMAEMRKTLNTRTASWLAEFSKMPPELLLILRTQNYLRHLNYEVGNGKVNRFRIMARMAVKGKDVHHGVNSETAFVYSNSLDVPSREGFVLQRRSWTSRVLALLHRLRFEYFLFREDFIRWLGVQWLHYFASKEQKEKLDTLAKSMGGDVKALFGG